MLLEVVLFWWIFLLIRFLPCLQFLTGFQLMLTLRTILSKELSRWRSWGQIYQGQGQLWVCVDILGRWAARWVSWCRGPWAVTRSLYHIDALRARSPSLPSHGRACPTLVCASQCFFRVSPQGRPSKPLQGLMIHQWVSRQPLCGKGRICTQCYISLQIDQPWGKTIKSVPCNVFAWFQGGIQQGDLYLWDNGWPCLDLWPNRDIPPEGGWLRNVMRFPSFSLAGYLTAYSLQLCRVTHAFVLPHDGCLQACHLSSQGRVWIPFYRCSLGDEYG